MEKRDNVIGIVAEYNPFHDGHKYLVEEAKKMLDADVCVSVMSGEFVQRGEPAVFDKWIRAEEAVKNGVDLVIELPVIYAVSGAEYFARGAVSILEGLGGVSHLAFGSESGDINALKKCSELLKSKDDCLSSLIKEYIREGLSYPAARERAVLAMDEKLDPSIVSEPNNILALEYLSKIKNMEPATVKRVGKGYHQSASEIRRDMIAQSEEFREELNRSKDRFFDILRAKILSEDVENLEKIASAGEGLGNRLKKYIRTAESLDDFLQEVKTKRYTMTRIKRLMVQTALNITEEDVKQGEIYVRVLAFNKKGGEFLKKIKKEELISIPVIDNINRDTEGLPNVRRTLEKDILASDIYNLITGKDLYKNSDYVKKPIFVK